MSLMPGWPQQRTLRHHLLHALGMAAGAALVAVALLPSGLNVANLDVTDARDQTAGVVTTPSDAHLVKLMHRYRCSTEGFGQSQIPGSAIIRRADGRTRVVSFDRGWTVFRADGPASLVAVCLDPPR